MLDPLSIVLVEICIFKNLLAKSFHKLDMLFYSLYVANVFPFVICLLTFLTIFFLYYIKVQNVFLNLATLSFVSSDISDKNLSE